MKIPIFFRFRKNVGKNPIFFEIWKILGFSRIKKTHFFWTRNSSLKKIVFCILENPNIFQILKKCWIQNFFFRIFSEKQICNIFCILKKYFFHPQFFVDPNCTKGSPNIKFYQQQTLISEFNYRKQKNVHLRERKSSILIHIRLNGPLSNSVAS